MEHRKWNKLMHITHGNTSAASLELVSLNVASMWSPYREERTTARLQEASPKWICLMRS